MSKFAGDVATQRKTAAAQVDLLRSAVETAGVRIGVALLPGLVKFVHFLASTVLPDVMKFGGAIAKALKNPWIEALLGGLLAAAVAIKVIITLTETWKTVQELLSAAFDDNALGIVIVAVAALAVAIGVLWERSATFRKIVETALHGVEIAFHSVLSVVMKVVSWITGHWKLLGGILIGAFIVLFPVIALIGAIGAGLVLLWTKSATFRKIVEGAFHAITGAAKAVFSWLKSNWPLVAGILLGPVALVAGLIYKYWNNIWRTMIAPVVRLFDGIKSAITGGFDAWWKSYGKSLEAVWRVAWDIIKAVVSPIFNAIKIDITIFVMVFKLLLAELSTIWKVAWAVISAIAKIAWVLISTVAKVAWADITTATRIAWDIIAAILKTAWAIIQAVFKVALAAIEAVIKIVWDVIVGIIDVGLDLLTGKWGKAWDDIKKTITQVWNAIKGFLSAAWSAIATAAVRTWHALESGVVSMASDLIGYFKKIPKMILDALGDVGKLLWNAGISIVKGLIGGIKSMIGAVGHAIGSVASKIKNFLPFSPAKEGPLSGKGDPFWSGKSIGKKIADGLTSSQSDVKKAAAATAATVKKVLAQVAAAVKSKNAVQITVAGTAVKLQQTAVKGQVTAVTSELNQSKGEKTHLDNLRKTEEGLIKALTAKRKTEDHDKPAGYKELRAAQEKEVKSLETLRSKQETHAKQTEQVSKTLRAELTKLKEEATKLKDALKKTTEAAKKAAAAATKAAAKADDSSDDSSDSSDDSSSSTPDWSAFGGFMAATAPPGAGGGSPGGPGGPGDPANGGGWRGNPGQLGPWGTGFDQGGRPRPIGRGGDPLGSFGTRDPLNGMILDRLDTLVSATMAAPAKNAAGMAAAMNGVSGTAILRGNW
jgi:phage-related protein